MLKLRIWFFLSTLHRRITSIKCKGHDFDITEYPKTMGLWSGLKTGECKKCKRKYFLDSPFERLRKCGLA